MKKAFSLIELILAIVIIGISASALPYIVQNSSKGVVNVALQEVVASGQAKINDVLSFSWNSAINDVNTSNHTIFVGHGHWSPLYSDATSRGEIERSKVPLKPLANNSSTTPIGVNDFKDEEVKEAVGSTDYAYNQKNIIMSYGSNMTVEYTSDPANCGTCTDYKTKNMKVDFSNLSKTGESDGLKVEIQLKGTDLEAAGVDAVDGIKLRAYTFNIGSIRNYR